MQSDSTRSRTDSKAPVRKGRIIGVDIGNYRIKMAACNNGVLEKFISVQHPDNMVKGNQIVSWQAMGDYLKELVKASGIRGKAAAVTLPQDSTYIRRTTMPLMTEAQLKINLPYEFHDYISDEPEKYAYDYAVISRNDREMDLMVVAAPKDLLEKYTAMFKRAGLKLTIAAPDVMAFTYIFREYERRNQTEHGTKDYVVLDLGDSKVELHFFSGGEYEITRSMEPGCRAIYDKVAEITGEDSHIVQMNAEAITAASATQPDSEVSEEVQDICSSMAVQIMRVLNFYSFNNPKNTIDAIYYCGGGAKFDALMKEIRNDTDMPLKSLSGILQADPKYSSLLEQSPQAYGITMS